MCNAVRPRTGPTEGVAGLSRPSIVIPPVPPTRTTTATRGRARGSGRGRGRARGGYFTPHLQGLVLL